MDKMKSVLISIRPKWCEKIANGELTTKNFVITSSVVSKRRVRRNRGAMLRSDKNERI